MNNLPSLLKDWVDSHLGNRIFTFREFANCSKLEYIIGTPAVIFSMILDGTLPTQVVKNIINSIDSLMTIGHMRQYIAPFYINLFKFVTTQPCSFYSTKEALKTFPKTQKKWMESLSTLLATKGIWDATDPKIVNTTNGFFAEERQNFSDDNLLNYWTSFFNIHQNDSQQQK